MSQNEIEKVISLTDEIYKKFGFKYTVELSTRSSKRSKNEISKFKNGSVLATKSLKHKFFDFIDDFKKSPLQIIEYGSKIKKRKCILFSKREAKALQSFLNQVLND